MSKTVEVSENTKVLKKWKSVKVLETYESASSLKKELLAADDTSKLEVKIKRCGDGGSMFRVKSWYPTKANSKTKPKNKTKKKDQ